MKRLLILAACLLLFTNTAFARETVRMTSLDWPPYTGADLEDGGAVFKVVKDAFERAGFELEVEFLPWKRAVFTAHSDDDVAGFFPEYYDESREKEFLFSLPVGFSPLGFVERSDMPIYWDKLEDLSGQRIGVVAGYVNTRRFDELVKKGVITTDEVVDDATNLHKLVAGRIDMAVMDRNVFEYLLATDNFLHGYRGRLQFCEHPLEVRAVYVCFKRTDRGKELLKQFNTAVGGMDTSRMSQENVQRLLREAENRLQ